MTIDALELEDLLAHKGWAWLRAQYEQASGPAQMVEQIRKIAATEADPQRQKAEIDRVLVIQRAIERFLALPEREIAKQRAQVRPDAEAPMRRRGVGL